MQSDYLPEGCRRMEESLDTLVKQEARLEKAIEQHWILEAKAIFCTAAHDLILEVGGLRGIIKREEGAVGIREGRVRDIALLARTGKPVCFCIEGRAKDEEGQPLLLCSRRRAQERCLTEYLDLLRPGDILPARVTHIEPFGCFADIGCGISALLPIDSISVSRIKSPADRVKNQQDIFVLLRQRDEQGRFLLSMKELLGTWAENAAAFSAGDTVCGVVRSVESYGVFIELAPNLTGLAEKKEGVEVGMLATVYIKSILPERMKIKLVLIDCFEAEQTPPPLPYRKKEGHISRFVYSPPGCAKQVETVFL